MKKKVFAVLTACVLVFALCSCTENEPEIKECDHEWDEGIVCIEAAYQKEGLKVFTCKLCGDTREEVLESLKLEPIPVPEDYEHEYVVKVNRLANVTTVYTRDENGEFTVPVRADLCSCGGEDTPLGEYPLGVRWTWATLIQHMYGQYTTRIIGDILFHTVPYGTKYDPSTLINGEYNKLGSTASHGCVRLTVEAAKWIYENCDKGTLCIIYEDEKPGPIDTTPVMKIRDDCGWDPTDPDPANPWLADPQYGL